MTMLDEFKRVLPKEMKLVSVKECNDKFNVVVEDASGAKWIGSIAKAVAPKMQKKYVMSVYHAMMAEFAMQRGDKDVCKAHLSLV
nr:MAG TPA: hypothetical protein [Caudoviricetes sp.]